jgi:amino acid transporter
MIVAFFPMLLVSFAYKYLNRADPDAGTTFAWTTRAMGPLFGWINGWAIFVADVIVMASLSVIASTYTFYLLSWHSAANSTTAIIIGSVVWIAIMTWICYRGIELSARTQLFLLSAEIVILAAFAVVALAKVYGGSAPAHSLHVSASWFNPFDMSFSALADALLLAIFIYWGWDSGVAVNEESEAPAEGPGRAAVMSTIILVLIYVIVSTAAQAYGGTQSLINNSNDVFKALGTGVFGSPWDKLLIIAVLTSASASTQTTILPTARTTLSMAHWGSIPKVFGKIHPRYLTPTVSTLGMGALSVVWTVFIVAFNPAQNVLGDSISALGFAVCFYYGFTGLACVIYFRRELRRNLRTLFLAGIVPLLGCIAMFVIFGKAYSYYSTAGNNYSKPLFGIEIPIVIGIGGLLLGVPLMLICAAKYREYFKRRPEVAPAGILEQPVEHASSHF